LSGRGMKVLQEHPDRVDISVLAQFPEYPDFQTRVTADVGGDPERVRYPIVRLVVWPSDELARRLGLCGKAFAPTT
jgi:hypothetical protein